MSGDSLSLYGLADASSMFSSPSETRKLQRIAREHIKRVLDEQEMLNYELENKKRRLDSWNKELNKREALTERERQKLEEEKAKVSLCSYYIYICMYADTSKCELTLHIQTWFPT